MAQKLKIVLELSELQAMSGNGICFEGAIYKTEEGWRPYDEASPQFDCYSPAHTGEFGIVDCWVCDKLGNIHPGYGHAPVPVCTKNLGGIVGILPGFNEE
jgi:hypothetical protein